MPARATMLTGLQQHNIPSLHRVGPYPGAEYDPEELPFWPKVFRERGYSTAQIGKWHVGTDTGYGRDWDYQYVWVPSSNTGKRLRVLCRPEDHSERETNRHGKCLRDRQLHEPGG